MTNHETRPLTDMSDLALALGGADDSFTGHLLRLIAKADPCNRERLALAFPRITAAWAVWAADLTEGLTAEDLNRMLPIDPFDRLPIEDLATLRLSLLATAAWVTRS